MTVRVFVYGTLKHNEHIGMRYPDYITYVEDDYVNDFTLVQCPGENYPRALPKPDAHIHGEIVDMKAPFLSDVTQMELSAGYYPLAITTGKGHTALLFVSRFMNHLKYPQGNTWPFTEQKDS